MSRASVVDYLGFAAFVLGVMAFLAGGVAGFVGGSRGGSPLAPFAYGAVAAFLLFGAGIYLRRLARRFQRSEVEPKPPQS